MKKAKQLTRRRFLKGSAVLAGTALADKLRIQSTAYAAGSDRIKFALIGCGGRGTGAAAQVLNTGAPTILWAMADAFSDRIEKSLSSLIKGREARYDSIDVPPERRFVGFDACQKAIDSGVDLVLLCTPPGFRPIHYRAAIEAGKHVFMEKPVCVDAPGFRSVMETNKLADKKDLKVAMGLNIRHTPKCVETVKQIHDGALGELVFQRAYCNNAGVWTRPREPGQTEMQYQMRNWYYFVWLCGDHIVEQHVHLLDLANWVKSYGLLTEGAHPVEANGMSGREVRKGRDHGQIYDHHFVEFTYADGSKLFSQCRQIPGCWGSTGNIAHGTQGVGDCTAGKITGKNTWQFKGKRVSGHQQEQNDLIKAIREDLKYNEGWYGAISSMTAILGRMASYSGQVVKWDDAVSKGPVEFPYTKKLTMNSVPPVLPDEKGSYPIPMPGVYKPY